MTASSPDTTSSSMLGKWFRKTDGTRQEDLTPAGVIRRLIAENRLPEARRAGEEAVAADPADIDVVKALVEVYLALEAQCIETNILSFLPEITRRVNELLPQLAVHDCALRERHDEIMRRSLPGYRELSEFENLSALPGHEKEAYEAAGRYIADNSPDPRLLPVYATVISRYLRVAASEPDSTLARRLLAEYLSLPVPRPSRVHSLFLRQAIRLARRFPEFKYGRFLEMWNPATMRREDIIDTEGKVPLAVSAFETLIDSDEVDRLPALLSRLPVNDSERLNVLRDAFAHVIQRYRKAGDTERACDLLTLYSRHASLHRPCRCHSLILEIALKVMVGSAEWRFPEFFVNWDPENFSKADFEPVTKPSGEEIPSLAIRALRRCYRTVSSDVDRYSYLLNRLLDAVDVMIRLCPGTPDELFRRRRAGIVGLLDRPDLALKQYAGMARERGRSIDFWVEYADLVHEHHLKASLFALALTSGGYDSDVQARLKLYLARELHFNGLDNDAMGLLDDYQEHCDAVAAEPLPVYGAIRDIIPVDTPSRIDNTFLYHSLAADALDYIYSDVPASLFSVIDIIDTRNLVITDSTEQLVLDTDVWKPLAHLANGENVEVKRLGKEVVMARKSAQNEPYAALRCRYGVVVAPGHIVCSSHSGEIPCPGVTDKFIRVKVYRDNEGQWRCLAPERAALADVRRQFDHLTGTVYAQDNELLCFTTGENGVSGTFSKGICEDLSVGEPYDFYYYMDGDTPVVFSVTKAIDPAECKAINRLSGPLIMNEDGSADVKGVYVPSSLMKPELKDTYVKVTAIYVPQDAPAFAHENSPAGCWHAMTVSLYD